LKQIFWAEQNLGGAKRIGTNCPPMHPRGYGPALQHPRASDCNIAASPIAALLQILQTQTAEV